jgi:sucrose-6-phosphate hydrolase SacC (GH32 family)
LHNESFRIFVDASSVEVFTADGKMAMTALIFPSSPYDRLCFRSETGGTNIKNLIVYPLK